jgi:hypothetical protein
MYAAGEHPSMKISLIPESGEVGAALYVYRRILCSPVILRPHHTVNPARAMM